MVHWRVLAALLLLLTGGSLVYCLLIAVAVWRYLQVRPGDAHYTPPISILKPLAGADEGLEENLESFFLQEYPEFEILFAVRDGSDPGSAGGRRPAVTVSGCGGGADRNRGAALSERKGL